MFFVKHFSNANNLMKIILKFLKEINFIEETEIYISNFEKKVQCRLEDTLAFSYRLTKGYPQMFYSIII